jgi:hypothetical protein
LLPKCNIEANSETYDLEFKGGFNSDSRQDWCELIKDIVAIANSGGGCIIFGIDDDGRSSGADITSILTTDPADIINMLHRYIEQQFYDFEISSATHDGHQIAVLRIASVRLPIIFTAPGTYPIGSTQKNAFSKGTIYFRHGPKSEPGTTEDLKLALDREIDRVKSFWLEGIGKVVAAPDGAIVQVVNRDVSLRDSPDASPIRLTNDEKAPVFRAIQADILYPYRLKELVRLLSERLGSAISSYNIQCVRKVYNVDDNPTFSYKAHWSPRQYSEAFVEWLVEQNRLDNEFITKAYAASRSSSTHSAGEIIQDA